MSKLVYPYIPYSKIDSSGKKIALVSRPEVPLIISYGHKLSRTFYALVDSGADKNLFPAALGELIGLNVRKGKTVEIGGIGGVRLTAHTHKVKLYIGSFSAEASVDFSYYHQKPLLGRNGFFDLFEKVSFIDQQLELVIRSKK